jgi:hypothetical protein
MDVERTNQIEGNHPARAVGTPADVNAYWAASSQPFSRSSAARAGHATALAANRAIASYDEARRRAIASIQRANILRVNWGKSFVQFKEEHPLESLTIIAGASFITGFLIRLGRRRKS